jgi:hypothetical protein
MESLWLVLLYSASEDLALSWFCVHVLKFSGIENVFFYLRDIKSAWTFELTLLLDGSLNQITFGLKICPVATLQLDHFISGGYRRGFAARLRRFLFNLIYHPKG